MAHRSLKALEVLNSVLHWIPQTNLLVHSQYFWKLQMAVQVHTKYSTWWHAPQPLSRCAVQSSDYTVSSLTLDYPDQPCTEVTTIEDQILERPEMFQISITGTSIPGDGGNIIILPDTPFEVTIEDNDGNWCREAWGARATVLYLCFGWPSEIMP